MFALWISVILNNELWESVPAAFDSYSECTEYKKQYEGIAFEAECFYTDTKLIVIKKG